MEFHPLNEFNQLSGDLINYIVSLLDEKALFLLCTVSKQTRHHILANVDLFLPIMSNQNSYYSIDPTIQLFFIEFKSLLTEMNQLYTQKYGTLLSSGPFDATNSAFLFNNIALRCRQLCYSSSLYVADTLRIVNIPEIEEGTSIPDELPGHVSYGKEHQGIPKTVFIVVRYNPVSLEVYNFLLVPEFKLARIIRANSLMCGKTITFYSPFIRDEYRRVYHNISVSDHEEKRKLLSRISHMLWLEENPLGRDQSIISSIKDELARL